MHRCSRRQLGLSASRIDNGQSNLRHAASSTEYVLRLNLNYRHANVLWSHYSYLGWLAILQRCIDFIAIKINLVP